MKTIRILVDLVLVLFVWFTGEGRFLDLIQAWAEVWNGTVDVGEVVYHETV